MNAAGAAFLLHYLKFIFFAPGKYTRIFFFSDAKKFKFQKFIFAENSEEEKADMCTSYI